MRQRRPIENVFNLTVVTHSGTPGHQNYWFNRKNLNTGLKPVKIKAQCLEQAWNVLADMEKGKC